MKASTPAPMRTAVASSSADATRLRGLPDAPLRAARRPVGRVRTLALACLSAFLVIDGVAVGDPSAPDGAAGSVARAAGPELDAAGIREILDGWNPSLDDSTQARIARAIERYSRQYELDPALVTAVVVVESSARPWAYSPKGAVGLMQVMPHMMDPLGLAGNPTTIESNIEAGCWILASNIERLGEERGISAYFWGSNIRNLVYLEKVREARESILRSRPS